MDVIFSGIERFPGYRFGDDGSVWSMKRGNRWMRLATRVDRHGYPRVNLYPSPGKMEIHLVHRLILEAFRGPLPRGLQGRHLNDIKADNRLENLAYGTQDENQEDRERNGGVLRGSRHGRAKLTEDHVRLIRLVADRGVSPQRIARGFRVSPGTVYFIVSRERWRHVS